jgi:hypothetical protein
VTGSQGVSGNLSMMGNRTLSLRGLSGKVGVTGSPLLLWFITSLSISHMSYFLACLEFLIQYQTFIQKKLQSPDGVILRKDCTLFLCQAECGAGPLHLTNSS